MQKLWTKDNFKCNRYCGECCKKLLVGLGKKDIKRIKKIGHTEDDFVMTLFNKKRLFLKKDKKG
tara:strand:+ start:249 stop:440 length:192 start_codon:yes stop_codon:yes gene_type:complete